MVTSAVLLFRAAWGKAWLVRQIDNVLPEIIEYPTIHGSLARTFTRS
jgi:hypothetical protein